VEKCEVLHTFLSFFFKEPHQNGRRTALFTCYPLSSLKDVIAGRPNLRYFDPSKNDRRFSPTGGGICYMPSFFVREQDRSISLAKWNIDD